MHTAKHMTTTASSSAVAGSASACATIPARPPGRARARSTDLAAMPTSLSDVHRAGRPLPRRSLYSLPMSRENRRRAGRSDAAAAPAPAPVAGRPGASDAQRTLSWRSIGIGLLAGEAVLFLLGNVGLGAANAVFGGTDRADGGVVGMASFLAVIIGGFVAARLAGRFGLYQGMWVGAGFIAVGAVTQFLIEANVVHSALQSGTHQLIDLGPMSMGNLVSGDLLALFGSSFGGWLGDARVARRGRRATR